MKWTETQYEAISNRGRNLLVSAAAGSGKTAVLVERIKQLILSDGCPIDRMLVVTFTDAAASEMKAKIEKAIRDEISRTGEGQTREDREKLALLKRQLDLLPSANISTFHSFAKEVIKKFFYVIGAEPNFRICDEAAKTIMEDKAMDELMETRYEEGGDAFKAFMDKFSGDRSDSRVREMISSLNFRLESLPFPEKWFREQRDRLACSQEEFLRGELMAELLRNAERTVTDSLLKLYDARERIDRAGALAAIPMIETDIKATEALKDAVSGGDVSEAFRAAGEYGLSNFRKDYFKPDKNPGADSLELSEACEYTDYIKKLVRKDINALKSDLFGESPERMHEELVSTLSDVDYLGDLVFSFRDIVSREKREKGLLDFSDLEHFALEILTHEEAAEYYRNRFRYIFVDEYQDSNVLQETLIGCIAGENNLFTVGDVKQSIYSFRLAEPEIFEDRYEKYKEEYEKDGDRSLSKKIDLNRNFRSKRSIIDFINQVFSVTMENYGEEAALYMGDPYGDMDNYPPVMYLTGEEWHDEDVDDAVKDMKKTEKEALLVVKVIRDHLGKPILDSKTGEERPLTLKDIVILLRSVKNRGDIFYKVLMENNISCYVDDSSGYFDTIEVNTFMALLSLIDNHKQDMPLLTVLRSEIMGFSITELAEIRACHKDGSFYSSLSAYSEEGEEPLRSRCREALMSISRWQAMAETVPLDELVWELMTETGFYASMGAMPGGSVRQANLRLLADKALDYRRNQGSGLYGFIGYVDHIKEKNIGMGQAKVVTEEDETVRIMTIHHSKGLEFPMVILSGYTRKLGGGPRGSRLAMDKDLGIGLPYADPKGLWYKETILQKLIRQKAGRNELKEEKRVLYVAMTRAMDILVMTGSAPDPQTALDEVRNKYPGAYSYFDMTGRVIASCPGRVKITDDRELAKIAGLRKRSVKGAMDILKASPGVPSSETERIMGYSYPYKDDLMVKSKYSVSELNARGYDHRMDFDASLPREPEKTGLSPAHVGTVTHKILEKADFAYLAGHDREEGSAYLDGLVRKMVEEEYLDRTEGDAIDREKLCEFAFSPLGRRIGEAQKKGLLFREKPFNIRMDVDGSEALVQGIIDCFFREGDELVLVDYKTTAARNVPGVKERYSTQMSIYRKALEASTGLKVKESYLYLTNIGLTVDMQ